MSHDNELTKTLGMAGYKHSSRCKICNALDVFTDKPIRIDAERVFADTHNYTRVAEYVAKHTGEKISIPSVMDHLKKHAPYSDMLRDSKEISKFLSNGIVQERLQGASVLEHIISVGFERVKSGEIIVDGTMLLKAVDIYERVRGGEQGKGAFAAAQQSWIRKLAQERAAVEGVVEEPVAIEEPPEPEVENTEEFNLAYLKKKEIDERPIPKKKWGKDTDLEMGKTGALEMLKELKNVT